VENPNPCRKTQISNKETDVYKDIIAPLIKSGSFVHSFALVAAIMAVSYFIAGAIKQKKMGSAFAITIGLLLAYIAGSLTGGKKGVADWPLFAGFATLGGAALRDLTIVSTAYGVDIKNLKKAGLPGIISLFVGVFLSFFIGAIIGRVMGYTDARELTTIGAGAVTFIVGPVTGDALGVSSPVIAVSVAAGVFKAVFTMIITPLLAKRIGLDNPTSAMVYGGIMGTTSGVAGGLAATDIRLVPYGAMTATFYTGLGTLLCPSVGFFLVKLFF
jgi:malonate transporter MadM subunit